jgi:hypothetical protein
MTKTGRTFADLIAEYPKVAVSIAIIICIIVLVLIRSKTHFKIGPVEIGSQPKIVTDSIASNSSINISDKKNIDGDGDGNVNNNGIINGNIFINKDIQNTNKKQNEYSITGTSNPRLINQILKKRKIRFVSNSSNNIEITYTGTIVLVDKNSNAYYYSGGHVKVMINQSDCFEFEEFKIDQMRPSSKDQIANEIQNSIDRYIDSNVELFSKKIVGCLKI